MDIKKRRIGKTNLEVTELGLGCAPIGGWPVLVNEEDAYLTIEASWEKGLRYFDTAPLYGSGMSEKRLGNFLSKKNKDDYVISTKVGRIIIDVENSKAVEKFVGSPNNKDSQFDFTYDGAMRSFEDSLKRLNIDKIDILHLHDPDNHPDHFEQSKSGAIQAMLKLRDEGVVTALGCGMNQNEMLTEYAKEGWFDCFLLAGRYTLADQTSLQTLVPICKEKNITLILGGVFNSGLLINPSPDTHFDYSKLDANWKKNLKESLVRNPKEHESADYWLSKAYALNDACKKHNIQLKEAAIQFPYYNEIVSTCILGMTSTSQVEENVNLYNKKISKEFWQYLHDNNLVDRSSPLPL